jgi:hypothetical protein
MIRRILTSALIVAGVTLGVGLMNAVTYSSVYRNYEDSLAQRLRHPVHIDAMGKGSESETSPDTTRSDTICVRYSDPTSASTSRQFHRMVRTPSVSLGGLDPIPPFWIPETDADPIVHRLFLKGWKGCRFGGDFPGGFDLWWYSHLHR